MNIGTKSLLFGAHWPLHNVAVALAWKWLYGTWPTVRELAAIALHDVGYVGCPEMDGPVGTTHPRLGAEIARHTLGEDMARLIEGHSKGFADAFGLPLSKLYGPDKCSHMFEPICWYVFRTRLTGELKMYRSMNHGASPRNNDPTVVDAEWFRIIRLRMARAGIEHAIKMTAPDGLGESQSKFADILDSVDAGTRAKKDEVEP